MEKAVHPMGQLRELHALGSRDILLFPLLEDRALASIQAVQESQVTFPPSHAYSTTPGQPTGFPKLKSAGDSSSQSLTHSRDERRSWIWICSLNFPQHSGLLRFNFLLQTYLQRRIHLGKTRIAH